MHDGSGCKELSKINLTLFLSKKTLDVSVNVTLMHHDAQIQFRMNIEHWFFVCLGFFFWSREGGGVRSRPIFLCKLKN